MNTKYLILLEKPLVMVLLALLLYSSYSYRRITKKEPITSDFLSKLDVGKKYASTTIRLICIVLSLILMVSINCNAQKNHSQVEKKRKPYTAIVKLVDGKRIKSVLYKANERSIELRKYSASTQAIDSQVVEITKIRWVRIRKKDNMGLAAMLGALSGAAIGFTIGYIEGDPDDPFVSAGELALIYAIPGVVIGAISAAVITKGKTYKIHGDQSNFYRIIEDLKHRQLVPE